MKIVVTNHAERRIRARMGSGFNMVSKAREVWDRGEHPPAEWEVPTTGYHQYRRHGSFLFVYGKGRIGDKVLITVCGPFGPDDKWENKKD